MPTPAEPNEAHLTAAVQRCCEAYHRVLAIPRPLDGKGSSKNFAEEAYRQAMPFLTSFDNIDAFIACVTHGMLLDAIGYDHGSKLLYAAQVAIASRRARQQAARSNSTNTANPAISASNTPTPSPSTVGAPAPGSPRTGLRPWGGDPSPLGTWDVTPTPSPATPPNPQPPTPPPSPMQQPTDPPTKKPVATVPPDPRLLHHAEKCLAACIEKTASSPTPRPLADSPVPQRP